MNAATPASSPKWSATAKLIFGLTVVGLGMVLLVYFRAFIGPLILAFVATYLLHPVVARINRSTRLNWRLAVALTYLVLLIILITSFTWAGVVIVRQVQSLLGVIQQFVSDIPAIAQDLSRRVYVLGPFRIELGQSIDWDTLANQLLQYVQPLLSQVTRLVGTFATSALETVGWLAFILLTSFFLLNDAGRVPDLRDYIRVPGYEADIRRMGLELGRIWNAFLRGQIIIFVLVVMSYTILMTILGVHFALGIAILAGLARFVPYLGPFVTWTVTILVAILQGQNYFGLEPVRYALLVIVLAIIVDQIFDNFVSPQIMGQTLRVHPAAVLLGALVAANLIGIIGVVLAAPVVATLKLMGRYFVRKMLDLDPWADMEPASPPDVIGLRKIVQWIRIWWQKLRRRGAG